MDINPLFAAALGLTPPWTVASVVFDPTGKEGQGLLRIELDFESGARFACSECSEACRAYDSRTQEWRHLDFFQHQTVLRARVPRVQCPRHGVRKISSLPWARPDSGFTLLFEAYVMLMCPQIAMKALARSVREHDTRLWRLVTRHVEKAREAVDMSQVKALVVDETSQARGHTYVSLFVEPGEEEARVLFVDDGRSSDTFTHFAKDLAEHGGSATRIQDVCMDMSAAFRKGAQDTMPQAKVTYDRFHVMKLASEAVDEVRRREQGTEPLLSGTRYTWLKNPANLTGEQYADFVRLSELNLDTVTAYHMRLNLQQVWRCRKATAARRLLGKWTGWVRRVCRERRVLEPMLKLAATIRKHRHGILHYFRQRMTSAVIEGFNSLVQAARARARGYRNAETFKTIIYLIGGRLKYDLPALHA